uniref:Sushi domain-containing protein n=1 Tax=Castor canadensis TaxID=51338 RepID=A0A8C0XXX8_CASCN
FFIKVSLIYLNHLNSILVMETLILKLKHGRLYYENRYRPYLSGHTGTKYIYYCDYNYVTASNTYWDYIYCTKEGWVPAVQCHRGCVFNYVENGISPSSSRKYVQDQSIKVQCYPGYSLPNKENTIVCTESGWSPPPKCIPSTIEYCIKVIITYTLKLQMDKYPSDSVGKCGSPPPIDNGDITSFPLPEYAQHSLVEYQCQSLYQLQGNKKITCRNGEWSEPPKCLNPCVISEEIMERHNIMFKSIGKQKLYVPSGTMVEFKCKHGYVQATSKPFHTTCYDGKLEFPTCRS